MKNFFCTKNFSNVCESLTLFFLQLCKKPFTQLNILSVLRKVNFFNNVSIGLPKSMVVASNSLTFFSLSQIHHC